MSDKITLTESELIEAKTHINLIQRAVRKIEVAQYAAKELESDFKNLINSHIAKNGGDPENQYALDTDSGTLERTMVELQGNNGAGDIKGIEDVAQS